MKSAMLLPDYYSDIVKILRSSDWLRHNFNCSSDEIFNAVNYQHNHQFEGIKYQVVLDMNILQYLLNIVKKSEPSIYSRTAAAYLTFFQISDIQLDPTYAIYEKICYSNDRADEAISNLEQIRGIDNHNQVELAEYALGYRKNLLVNPIKVDNRDSLKSDLLKYRRLTDWDSLYLCILSITNIHLSSSIPHSKKIIAFIEWSIREFRFSIAALVYASVLFGRTPESNMMKYKTNSSIKKQKSSFSNMTWDLYYLDRYMKTWCSENKNIETLILTADKALNLSIKLAVECQISEGIEPLRSHVGNNFDKLVFSYENRNSNDRAYNKPYWGYEYRDNLIKKLESKLLKNELLI